MESQKGNSSLEKVTQPFGYSAINIAMSLIQIISSSTY